MDLTGEIMRRLEALPREQQRQLIACFDALEEGTPPAGEKGSTLLPFAGALDHASAVEMSDAILSACETIDAREW